MMRSLQNHHLLQRVVRSGLVLPVLPGGPRSPNIGGSSHAVRKEGNNIEPLYTVLLEKILRIRFIFIEHRYEKI